MKKCLFYFFTLLSLCFGLCMGFGSNVVFAFEIPSVGVSYSGNSSFVPLYTKYLSNGNTVNTSFSSSNEFRYFGLRLDGVPDNYDDCYFVVYSLSSSNPTFKSVWNGGSGSESFNSFNFSLTSDTTVYVWFKDIGNSSSNIDTIQFDSLFFIDNTLNSSNFGSSFSGLKSLITHIIDGSFSPTPSIFTYDSEIGYLVNVTNSNSVSSFTNGGKDWINVISYDEFTSTGVDMLSNGMQVQYFFEFNGSYGSSFGLGSSKKMSTYYSEPFYSTGLNFSYNSELWRQLYDDWCLQNNLGSTDRVKEAYLTIWVRPMRSSYFYGDWVKLNEDGSSYLITSSQPFEGSDSPSSVNTSLGGQTNVSNTQNGNSVNTWEQISSGDIDYSEIQKSVKGLSSLIGDIPGMISTLFSWLPAWVITFLASCIALWGVIALIKLLRG